MPKILLVEDEELNRDMLARRLERNGYQVVIAVDGEQGIALAQSEAPQLILMDLRLKPDGLDGWEATRLIKASSLTRPIPIIALTADVTVDVKDRALEAGCDDYDTKPVDLRRLLGKIDALLKKDIRS